MLDQIIPMEYSRRVALEAVDQIKAHLQAAHRELLLFQRYKGHVSLGYADNTEGLRQCIQDHFGRSLSWFYRRAQEAKIIELSPTCENLSGRALRQLSKASDAGMGAVLELAASTGKITESTIKHAADVINEALVCGTVPDGAGGQVPVKKALEQAVQNSIKEAAIRHGDTPLLQGKARVAMQYVSEGLTYITFTLDDERPFPLHIPTEVFINIYPIR